MGKTNRSKSQLKSSRLVNQHDVPTKVNPGSTNKSKKTTKPVGKLDKTVRQERKKISPNSDKKGTKVVSGIKGAVQRISDSVELASTQCNSRGVPLRIAGYRRILAWFIDRLSKDHPNLFLLTGTAIDITPKDVWIYGHVMLFASLRQTGTFTGAQTQNLPDFKTESIPYPIAKAIQYLRPYINGDSELKQSYDFSLGTAVGDSTVGVGTAGWPLPGIVYDCLAEVTTSSIGGHIFRSTQAGSGAWADWIKDRFNIVSSRLKQMVGGVDGAQISLAPDGSGYSYRNNNNYASLTGMNVNPEMAMLFSEGQGSAGLDCLLRPLLNGSEVPDRPSTVASTKWDVNDQIASTFVFLMSRTPTWPHGPIERVKFNGQPIKSLIPNYKRTFGTMFFNVVGAAYAALTSLNPSFTDKLPTPPPPIDPNAGGPLSKFLELLWACEILFHKRCERHSPLFSLAGKITTNAFFPQAFFNPGLDGIPVPPIVQDMINSIGCVVHHGYLVVPYIQCNRMYEGTADPKEWTLMNLSVDLSPSTRTTGVTSNYQFPFTGINNSVASPPPVPNVVLGNIKYDAAWMLSWVSLNASENGATYFPANRYPELMNSLNQLFNTVGGIYTNMVEFTEASALFGAASQMLTQGFGRAGDQVVIQSAVTQFDEEKGVSSLLNQQYFLPYLSPSTIVSAIPLNNVEILCALAFNVNSSADATVVGPESLQLNNIPVTSNFVRLALGQSFTPNANAEPGTVTSKNPVSYQKGLQVITKLDADDERADKQYRDLLCMAASAAMRVAPYACSGLEMAAAQVPILTAFLQGRVKSVCESGIEQVVHYVLHRCMTTSKESMRPKQGDVFAEAKREMADLAIAAGLNDSMVKTLLKGASEAFKLRAAYAGQNTNTVG